MSRALEDVENAKYELLKSYDHVNELKKALENADIVRRVYKLARSNIYNYNNGRFEWLSTDQNYKYVDKALKVYGYNGESIIDLIDMGQSIKNEELLHKAIDELKKEYGIEYIHSKRSMRETISMNYKEKLRILKHKLKRSSREDLGRENDLILNRILYNWEKEYKGEVLDDDMVDDLYVKLVNSLNDISHNTAYKAEAIKSKTSNRMLPEKGVKQRARPNPAFDSTDKRVKDNKDHFPLGSLSQAKNAWARVNQYSKAPDWWNGTLTELKQELKKAIKKKYKSYNPGE